MKHFCQKWKKEKKWILSGNKRVTRGREMWFALQCTFCVCEINLFLTNQFFHFGINNGFVIPKEEFWKNNLCRGIKYIFQMQIWKIWLICKFFVPGGSKDTWLSPRTCCRKVTEKNWKKGQPSDSVPGILGHVPVLRTCQGYDRDISNSALRRVSLSTLSLRGYWGMLRILSFYSDWACLL